MSISSYHHRRNIRTFVQKIVPIFLCAAQVIAGVIVPLAGGFSGGINVAEAQATAQINYQGKLTNSSGVTVNDGIYNMEFKLYTASSSGSAIWTETRTGGNRVQITDGLFSVMLGSVASLSGINFNQPLWLGVNIGGTGSPSWDGEMSPRKTLGTVPSAFTAQNLEGLRAQQFLRSDILNSTSSASTYLSVQQNGIGAIAQFIGNASTTLMGLYSANDGQVTIGTTTPMATFKLTVDGSAKITSTLDVDGQILGKATADASTSPAYSWSGDTNTGMFRPAADTVAFSTGGIEQLRITSAGNIGIGTTTPNDKLSVAGSVNITGALKFGGAAGTNGQILQSTGVSAQWVSTSTLGLGNGSYRGLSDTQSTFTANRIIHTNSAGTALTDSAGFVFDGTNLGIGTTTPASSVHVVRSSNSVYAMTIQNGGGFGLGLNIMVGSQNDASVPFRVARFNDTEMFRVNGDGNVGIGTSTPGNRLVVNGTGGLVDMVISDLQPVLAFDDVNLSRRYEIGTHVVDGEFSIFDRAASTNRFHITTDGNIGLGISAAGAKLDVATSSPTIRLTDTRNMVWNGDERMGGLEFYTSDTSSIGQRVIGGIEIFNDYGSSVNNPSAAMVFSTAAVSSTTVERMRITSAGNVGIGTSSPLQKLSVAGTGLFTGLLTATQDDAAGSALAIGSGINAPANISFQATRGYAGYDGVDAVLQGGPAKGIKFIVDGTTFGSGTTAVKITTAGSVGIGTTNPASHLSVQTAATGSAAFQFSDGVNYTIRGGYAASGVGYFGGLAGSALSLRANGADVMRLSATGNVGIGTTTPTYKLDVSVTSSAAMRIWNTSSTSALTALYLNDTGAGLETNVYGSGYVLGSRFDVGANGLAIAGSQTGAMAIGTVASQPLYFATAGTERMRISPLGNVGIGTSTPGARFHLYTEEMLNGGTAVLIESDGDSNDYIAKFRSKGVPGDGFSDSDNKVVITGFGNVGIGTSSPVANLSVVGSGTAPNFIIASSSGATQLAVLSNGNVGIGTDAPNSLFEVSSATDGATIRITSRQNDSNHSSTTPYGQLVFWSNDNSGAGNNERASIRVFDTANSGSIGHMAFYTSPSGGPTERMRIGADGNIGIGTTSAISRLHVNEGTISVTGSGNRGFIVYNQNEVATTSSSVSLNWLNDVARIRVAGDGSGAGNGFDIQGTADRSLMRILNSGNVGIGTTTPDVRLSIVGTGANLLYLHRSDSLANVAMEFRNASSSTFIGRPSASSGNLFAINNVLDLTASPFMVVSTTGNVGIGSSSPSNRLTVLASTNTEYAASITNVGSDGLGLSVQTGATSGDLEPILSLSRSDAEVFRVQANGNVGIGTSNPQRTLHVYEGSFTGAGVMWAEGTTNSVDALGNPLSVIRTTSGDMTDGFGASIAFATQDNANVLNNIGVIGFERSGADNSGKFVVRTYSAGSAGPDDLVILPNGNVGLGSSTPIANLSVVGSGTTPNFIVASSTGATQLTVLSNGNVGIGTSSPSKSLHVVQGAGSMPALGSQVAILQNNASNGDNAFLAVISGQSALTGIQLGDSSNLADGYVYYDNAARAMRFGTAASDSMTILANGNVGLGSSTPTSKLQVVGGIVSGIPQNAAVLSGLSVKQSADNLVSGIILEASGNTRNGGMYQNGAGLVLRENGTDTLTAQSGSVGIGASTPSYKLQVGSNITFMTFTGGTLPYGTTSEPQILAGVTSGEAAVGLGVNDGTNNRRAKFFVDDTNSVWGLKSTYGAGGRQPFVISQANNEVFRIDSAGNIGMGTTTPSARLHIVGTPTVHGLSVNTGDAGTILSSFNTSASLLPQHFFLRHSFANVEMGNSRVGNLSLFTNDTEKVTILSNGNVGIGTTSPTSMLDVAGGAVTRGVHEFYGGTTNTTRSLTMRFDATYQGASNVLRFRQGGSTAGGIAFSFFDEMPNLFMAYGGNVGIGTTTPDYRLTVAGDLSLTGAFRANGNAGTAGSILMTTGTSTQWVATSSLGIIGTGTVYAGTAGQIAYYDTSTNAVSGTSTLFLFGGNVGVGTTTPGVRLAVEGDMSVSGGLSVYNPAATSTFAGMVGIGTAAPTAELDVTNNNLGTTAGDVSGLALVNNTPAAAGAQQISPIIRFTGQGWKTTATAGSQRVDWKMYSLPVQGTTNASSNFLMQSSVNGGAYTSRFTLSSAGALSSVTSITMGGALSGVTTIANSSTHTLTRTALANASTDGFIMTNTTAATLGAQVQRSPRLRLSGTAWDVGAGASRTTNWIMENIPSGSTPASSRLAFSHDLNAGGYTEYFSIQSNGNVGIGTTTPSQALVASGTIQSTDLLGGATTLSTDANGNIIRTPSDSKLKTGVEAIEGALDKVSRLRGVSYSWIDQARFGKDREIGFLAQELELVVPEVVKSGGEYKSVNYQSLVALLAEAIKELKGEVDGFANNFKSKNIESEQVNSTEVKTDKLCVGTLCLTEAELRTMMQNQGTHPAAPTPPATVDEPGGEIPEEPETPAETVPGDDDAGDEPSAEDTGGENEAEEPADPAPEVAVETPAPAPVE